MTTTTLTGPVAGVRSHSTSALIGCGVGGAASYVGSAVLFADALAGSGTAAEAATALTAAAGRTQAAVLLLTLAVLLLARVVAELAQRIGDSAPGRLVLPLGVAHLVALAAGFWGLSGAIAVGRDVFAAEVSATGAETGLVLLNTFSPLSALLAAGFLAVVAVTGRAALPRWVSISAAVLAVLLVPPMTAWAALYLVPLWLGAVAISLSRR